MFISHPSYAQFYKKKPSFIQEVDGRGKNLMEWVTQSLLIYLVFLSFCLFGCKMEIIISLTGLWWEVNEIINLIHQLLWLAQLGAQLIIWCSLVFKNIPIDTAMKLAWFVSCVCTRRGVISTERSPFLSSVSPCGNELITQDSLIMSKWCVEGLLFHAGKVAWWVMEWEYLSFSLSLALSFFIY